MPKKSENESNDEHIWEIGKGRVIIRNGKVHSVSEPLVKYCPIHEVWSGFKYHTIKSIKKHTQWKIRDFGLCTKNRILITKNQGIGYGCSETFMSAMQNHLVDAVVIPCDGAGTVVTDRPEVEQAIGGPMNALIKTSPIPEVISRLQELGAIVIYPETAKLDVLKGVEVAITHGYQKIGVIVIGPEAPLIEDLRALETQKGVQLIIFVVHTTGIPPTYLKYIDKADMVHGCASKVLREYLDKRARKKYGSLIPAYAISEIGERILNIREEECLKKPPMIVVGDRKPPDLI
ncbi:MAG: methanogenesis marker 8 protein [Candidatus Helarchaeota archaeon]